MTDKLDDSTGILSSYRVIDFSRLAPGPMTTMVLGDLGADVIKVEEPGGVGERGMSESCKVNPETITRRRNGAGARLTRSNVTSAVSLSTSGATAAVISLFGC